MTDICSRINWPTETSSICSCWLFLETLHQHLYSNARDEGQNLKLRITIQRQKCWTTPSVPAPDDWNLQPHAVNILPIKPGGRVSNSNWRDLPHAFLLYIFVFHHIDSIVKQRKKALHLQYTKYKSPIPGHWVMFIGCFKKLKNTMVVTRITLQINVVFDHDVMIRDDVNNERTTATVGRFIFQPVSATCGKSFPSATLCCVGHMSLCSSVTCNQRIWLITQQKYNYSLDPLYNLWV